MLNTTLDNCSYDPVAFWMSLAFPLRLGRRSRGECSM